MKKDNIHENVNKNVLEKLPKWVQKKNVTWLEYENGKYNSGIRFYDLVIEENNKESTFHADTFSELKWMLAQWKKDGCPDGFCSMEVW